MLKKKKKGCSGKDLQKKKVLSWVVCQGLAGKEGSEDSGRTISPIAQD